MIVDLKVGQTHKLQVSTGEIVLEIQRLSTSEVEFIVSGDLVENPEQPRILPMGTFVKWPRFHKEIRLNLAEQE